MCVAVLFRAHLGIVVLSTRNNNNNNHWSEWHRGPSEQREGDGRTVDNAELIPNKLDTFN